MKLRGSIKPYLGRDLFDFLRGATDANLSANRLIANCKGPPKAHYTSISGVSSRQVYLRTVRDALPSASHVLLIFWQMGVKIFGPCSEKRHFLKLFFREEKENTWQIIPVWRSWIIKFSKSANISNESSILSALLNKRLESPEISSHFCLIGTHFSFPLIIWTFAPVFLRTKNNASDEGTIIESF